MESQRSRALRKIVYALDATLAVAAAALSFLSHGLLLDFVPLLKKTPVFGEYALIAMLTVPLWMILVGVFGLQKVFERHWTPAEILTKLLKMHLAGLLLLVLAVFLTQSTINRSVVGLFLLYDFLIMAGVHLIFAYWQRYTWQYGHGRPRVLLVGAARGLMLDFVDQARQDSLPPQFIGHVGEKNNDKNPAIRTSRAEILPYLGDVDEMERILHDANADSVLFFPPHETPFKALKALRACEQVGVSARFAIDLTRPGMAEPQVISMCGSPFITFDVAPKAPELLALKTGFDTVVAALGLILLSPLLLLTSLAILITMGRPVFFVQKRAGLAGRTFRMLKFRTMVVGAAEQRKSLESDNEMSGPVFKITADPRVTKLGGFLRRTSLDELPQLINVLTGTMSLIGPRPLPIEEQREIRGWHRRRLSMKPGITGLWQVSGRSNVDFEDWMKLDLRYVDQWSPTLDLTILLKTIPAVLTKKGAK